MAVTGEPLHFDKKFLFAVEFDGIPELKVESVSGLEFETEVVEQHAGGSVIVEDQSPGKTKFSPITFMIPASASRAYYEWALQVTDAAANSGSVDNTYKRNGAVVQLDRDGSEKRRYTIYDAWPSKYKSGEWDGKASENVMEEVTITFRYYERED